MAKKTYYTVYLHPAPGYWNRSTNPNRKTPSKKFNSLPALLQWVDGIVRTARKRGRPWAHYQVFKTAQYDSQDLLFAPVIGWHYDPVTCKYVQS